MEVPQVPSPPLARIQAVARIFRDLCIGASAVWLVLGVPAILATAIEHAIGSAVDTSEVSRQELANLCADEALDRRLREDLDSGHLDDCFERIDLGALKNTQRLACLHEKQKRLQAILDVEAGKFREAAGPSEVGAVGAANRAWTAFRDRWCHLQAIRNEAPHPKVNQYFCSVELTREYIVLIRKAG
jgi:hypothetical protein